MYLCMCMSMGMGIHIYTYVHTPLKSIQSNGHTEGAKFCLSVARVCLAALRSQSMTIVISKQCFKSVYIA